MSFESPFFLTIFVPAVLLGAWAAGRVFRTKTAANALLLLASLSFAAWGGAATLACLLAGVAANDAAVRAMARAASPAARRRWCGAIVAGNLLLLGVVKYAGFVAGAVNAAAGTRFAAPSWAVLGISFTVFRAISYAVDVFRGEIEPAATPFDFACALAFFPVLTAGPIARLGPTLRELRERETTAADAAQGLRRFLLGLAKKALVADTLAPYADAVWGHAANGLAMPPHLAAFGLACYSLQLYYDFSGYTDMAVGLGRMLGFTLPENFDHPYAAVSVRDFWRRWHASLSSWFRDYLYIPLGGNRKGLARACWNGLLVFALCGLWHGAGWMFLLWGLWHGLFITLERLALARRPKGAAFLPAPLGHAYAAFVFLAGWLLFRSSSLAECGVMARSILGLATPAAATRMLLVDASPRVIVTAAVAALFAFPPPRPLRRFMEDLAARPAPSRLLRAASDAAITLLALAALLSAAGSSYHAFLYAQF